MFRPLLKKSVHDTKWLLAACTAAIFSFCWLRVWIVTRLDTSSFETILGMLPGDWQRFTPVDFAWLITYAGRVALAYDELIVVVCVAVWAISRGSDSISGEIGRGTMEMLLGQPISRIKLLSINVIVSVAGVVVLATAAWLGNYVGIHTVWIEEQVQPSISLPLYLPLIGSEIPIPFVASETRLVPMTDKIDANVLIPASINLAALGVMLAGFTTLMSSWDRYRWRTIGIVMGIFVVQVMIKLAGMASDDWGWLVYFSILTAYEPELMVRIADTSPESLWSWTMTERGVAVWGPLAYHAVMVGVGGAAYLMAAIIFAKRDIPAPL